MGQDHHDRGLVGTGVDLQVFADADQAGLVVALILDRSGQSLQSVQLTAAAAGQAGFVKGDDGYYYYKESSLEGAKNAQFAKDTTAFILQSFTVPYSSFFDSNGNMIIKNSETVYIKLVVEEHADEDFGMGE